MKRLSVCLLRWIHMLPVHLFHTDWTIVAPLFYSLRFSVSLPAYICKGVAENPHVHRAVSHQCFLKLLWIWKRNNTVCFPAVTVWHNTLVGNVRVRREDTKVLPRSAVETLKLCISSFPQISHSWLKLKGKKKQIPPPTSSLLLLCIIPNFLITGLGKKRFSL